MTFTISILQAKHRQCILWTQATALVSSGRNRHTEENLPGTYWQAVQYSLNTHSKVHDAVCVPQGLFKSNRHCLWVLPWMVALDSYTQGRCDITIFSFMSLEVLSHEGVYRFVWQGDDSIICFTPSKHFWKSFWNRNRKAFKNTSFMEIVSL